MRKYIRNSRSTDLNRKAQIQAVKDKSYQIIQEIEQLFIDNDIPAEYVNSKIIGAGDRHPSVEVCFEMEGDWKHTHAFADELVKSNFDVFGCLEEDVYSEYDDDYYSAVHRYLIFIHV